MSGHAKATYASSVVEHSLAVVELSRPLVEAVQRRDRELASQLRRSISRISLNLAEAFGTTAGNARLRFQTALGSVNEAESAIRVAIAWGYFKQEAARPTLESPACARRAGVWVGAAVDRFANTSFLPAGGWPWSAVG